VNVSLFIAINKTLDLLKPGTVYDAVRIELRTKFSGIRVNPNPIWDSSLQSWVGECTYKNIVYNWTVA